MTMADSTEQSTFGIISQMKPSEPAHTQNFLCDGQDEHHPIYNLCLISNFCWYSSSFLPVPNAQ
jgi:hypothetical protein